MSLEWTAESGQMRAQDPTPIDPTPIRTTARFNTVHGQPVNHMNPVALQMEFASMMQKMMKQKEFQTHAKI